MLSLWARPAMLLLSVFVFQPIFVLLVVCFTIRVNRCVMTQSSCDADEFQTRHSLTLLVFLALVHYFSFLLVIFQICLISFQVETGFFSGKQPA